MVHQSQVRFGGGGGVCKNPDWRACGLNHLPMSSAPSLAKPAGLPLPFPCSRSHPTSLAAVATPFAMGYQDVVNKEFIFPLP